MRNLWIVLLCLFFSQQVFGFEIVYPKTKNPTINSPTTFFIGSSKTPLTINGISVPLHSTGAFAYFVKLPSNVNTFKIQSGEQTETYIISKKISSKKYSTPNLIEYNSIKPLIVEVENSPLRSTPIDAGINRISHFQKGVLLNANGEKGSFYRIKLNENMNAWISKNNVKPAEAFSPAKIKGHHFRENETNFELKLHLDKRIPFEIIEGDTIKLKFYNTEKPYVFNFSYKEKTKTSQLYGYSGKYIDNDFIFTINKPPKPDKYQPLKGITITVDAGHGGKEKGAIGCLGDNEKDVVLKMAKYLQEELTINGANVIMTRTDDSSIGLSDRVKISNENNSMFFISIHNNALPDTLNPNDHRGTSTYYYYEQSEPLARTILNTMTSELGTKNDQIHRQSFAVVRNTNALSILIEVAYLINPDDNELLINPDFQKNVAKSIVKGLENFITQN